MGISMDVEGMDELIGRLQDIRNSFGAEARCEWAAKVEKRARQLCGDKDERHIIFHCDEKRKIMLSADERGKDCLLRAIMELYSSMPLGVQAFFQGVVQTLEKQPPTEC